MLTLPQTIEVAADPDTAWRVLGDLAAVDRWIPGITKVEMEGMTRVCTFADGHAQREAILDYSPAARSYCYTIDGGLPVSDNRGRFGRARRQRRADRVGVELRGPRPGCRSRGQPAVGRHAADRARQPQDPHRAALTRR